MVHCTVCGGGSFDELCDPGCARGVLWRINLTILLAMARHEYYLAVEHLDRLVHCETEILPVTLISGTT